MHRPQLALGATQLAVDELFQPTLSLIHISAMTDRAADTPNFNRIARLYRWMEYATFGWSLERCRNRFLPQLQECRRALVLGDGDGRFLAHLLAINPGLRADAVDASAHMLHLLRTRCSAVTGLRLRIHNRSALEHAPASSTDLIVTHFFLDCLTQSEVDELARRLARHIRPGALWVVSEFRIPAGAMHWPSRILVRLLYLAFRLVTGLRTRELPDHPAALTSAGLVCIAQHLTLAGLLTRDVYKRQVNNLLVQSPSAAVAAATPPPIPAPAAKPKKPSAAIAKQSPPPPAPIERSAPQPAPSTPAPVVAQAPPPPPPAPVVHEITLPPGTTLPVRITETLDSATTQTGDKFTGVIASDIIVDNMVVLPQGTSVTGHVDAAQDAAHYKGLSLIHI